MKGKHEIFFFLKGGNRKFSDVSWGEQFIFMNLNPIPGAPPPVVKMILPSVEY